MKVVVYLGLLDAAIIFPISLIGFEKMRRKIMFWKKRYGLILLSNYYS